VRRRDEEEEEDEVVVVEARAGAEGLKSDAKETPVTVVERGRVEVVADDDGGTFPPGDGGGVRRGSDDAVGLPSGGGGRLRCSVGGRVGVAAMVKLFEME
jgi:hypothetical protein